MVHTLDELVDGMNAIAGEPRPDQAHLEAQIVARDREIANPFSKDAHGRHVHGG